VENGCNESSQFSPFCNTPLGFAQENSDTAEKQSAGAQKPPGALKIFRKLHRIRFLALSVFDCIITGTSVLGRSTERKTCAEWYRALPPSPLLALVVSEKSIVRCWAIPKWSVQSDRYGDVSISGCRSIPRWIVHQQSRPACSEFRCNGSIGHHVSRSKVGVILRQLCGSSSSAARRDVPADALRLGGPRAQASTPTRVTDERVFDRRARNPRDPSPASVSAAYRRHRAWRQLCNYLR
jgi:hypothetical protein